MNAPCYGCTDRHVGCHAKCDKYQLYHAERVKVYAKHKEDAELNEFLSAVRRHINDRNRLSNISAKRK